MNSYANAKKVFDFYMEQLANDSSKEAQFAQQYANLKLLRYRTEGILNSLESYEITTE